MDRIVNRRYHLSADEVRDAILDKLSEQDVPTPKKYDEVKFSMTENGVTIEWTDHV